MMARAIARERSLVSILAIRLRSSLTRVSGSFSSEASEE